MYARLLRDSKVDAAWVRYVVGHDELFDKAVPLNPEEPMGVAYTEWLRLLTTGLGLAWSEHLTAMPTYLQFRSVGWHADGFLEPYGQEGGQ